MAGNNYKIKVAMSPRTVVISATSHDFARYFATKKSLDCVDIRTDRFSDGEVCISDIDERSVAGREVYIIHQFSFFSGQDINSQIFEFLCLVRKIKAAGALRITAVLPYFPYSRQDDYVDNKLVGLSALFADLAGSAGVDHILCCDIHSPQIISSLSIPVTTISLDDFWSDFIRSTFDVSSILVSPDQGSQQRASQIAHAIDRPFVCLAKKRVGKNRTQTLSLDERITGNLVVLYDDILDTGSTAIDASAALIDAGATQVFGIFTHAVLSSDALTRLALSNLSRVIVSNSIIVPKEYTNSSIEIVSLDAYLTQKISI